MSERFAKVYAEAILDDRLTWVDLRVLIALLLHADREGFCYPSRATIARFARIREREVSLRTNRLVEFGWLQKSGKGGRSRTCRYWVKVPRLQLETVPELSTVSNTGTVHDLRSNGTLNQSETVLNSGRGIEQTMNRKEQGGAPDRFLSSLEKRFPDINVRDEMEKLKDYKGEDALGSNEITLRWLNHHVRYRAQRGLEGTPEQGSLNANIRADNERAKAIAQRERYKIQNLAGKWAGDRTEMDETDASKFARIFVPEGQQDYFFEIAKGIIWRNTHSLSEELAKTLNESVDQRLEGSNVFVEEHI